jgi:hypothetical protein
MKNTLARLTAIAIAILSATATTSAATNYATSPAYEKTVASIAQAVNACVHHSGAYIGPVKIKNIALLDNTYARADVSLGISGDSAAIVVLARTKTGWACDGGGGGAINARNVPNVPTSARNNLIAQQHLQPILAKPIYFAAPPHSIFVIQTPGHP